MSILNTLFGESEDEARDRKAIQKHIDYLRSLSLPAIALTASTEAGLSRIGGLPSLPDGEPWPEWGGKPLAFLCQLDLGALPADCRSHGLPPSGMLYFFYDQEQSTWGFDPQDQESWRVLYTSAPSDHGTPCAAPAGMSREYVYIEKPVSFYAIETYPDWQDGRIDSLHLSDGQLDIYGALCTSGFGNNPLHQLFGYPSPAQGNDMDLECQLVSHGLWCGDESGYQDERAKVLEAGRRDWVLLLQLDSDDDTGMMWGDCGLLYFWIRKQDLAKGHFDRCWMILQCS